MDITSENVSERVEAMMQSDASFALFRLPRESAYTIVAQEGKPTELGRIEDVRDRCGVLIAPFLKTEDCPIVLVRADVCETLPLPSALSSSSTLKIRGAYSDRQAYSAAFRECLHRLKNNQLAKVVLARREKVHFEGSGLDVVSIFFRACQENPQSYVSLWKTAQTGVWLTATPELLLSSTAEGVCHTVALAGTMTADTPDCLAVEKWSDKNRDEQEIVADYVNSALSPIVGNSLSKSKLRVQLAGSIAHLVNDFSFRTNSINGVGEILKRLHPTPAVCGYPLQEALATIQHTEKFPRRYYAGFSGPLNLKEGTSLFVSLRCMNIAESEALLYAGGGLLPQSVEEDEWRETCRKLETMRHLFS